MIRLLLVCLIIGLILVIFFEWRGRRKSRLVESRLLEEERALAVEADRQERERVIRRTRSALKAKDKFSEVDDVLATIDLDKREEK